MLIQLQVFVNSFFVPEILRQPTFKVDDVILENVTHEFAVNTLKQTASKVTLIYLKNPHPELLPSFEDSGNRSFGAPPTPARSGKLQRHSSNSVGIFSDFIVCCQSVNRSD